MQFTIDTADKLRAVAEFFTPDDWKALEAEGLISSIVHATNNQEVLGGNYTGVAKTRRVWVWGDVYSRDIVGELCDWEAIEVSAIPVAQTVGYGMTLVPALRQQLARQNGGLAPPIIQPQMPR